MNFRYVFKVMGRVLIIEAVFMLLPLLLSIMDNEPVRPFLVSSLILFAIGIPLTLIRSDRRFYAREGFFTVALTYIFFSIFGAVPYILCGQFPSLIDCFFESVSGFTTTGATILSDVESLPHSILLWRALSQWLGGMGVLVLTTALIPSLGASSKYLINAELPGPIKSQITSKISDQSRMLYAIYCALTFIEMMCLRFAGMRWFDALTTALTTAATGGFSVNNDSIAGYGSLSVTVIISIFMTLFSINFTLYILILLGRVREALRSEELHFFIGILLFAFISISFSIAKQYGGFLEAAPHAYFQVIAILSSTGFSIDDYNRWPEFARIILCILMFIGACSGSTAGGFKCGRLLLIFKGIRQEIRSVIHPNAVTVVRMDHRPVSNSTVHTAFVFLGAYICLWLGGSVLLAFEPNTSLETTATAVMASLSNVGPGMAGVGPTRTFDFFSIPSKIFLMLCMIIGRVEIFPILVLFSRSSWKK